MSSLTARNGEQHGYFADNCPLPKNLKSPPYRPAANLFAAKVRQNLARVEQFYAFFERDGRDPSRELSRATVLHADINTAELGDLGIEENSIAAIISSPPYLCMADYVARAAAVVPVCRPWSHGR